MDATGTAGLQTGCTVVLIVVADGTARRELLAACHAAGTPAVAVSRIGEVEYWPQTVIVDSAHLTPIWREFGAREVILWARTPEEGATALDKGATGWMVAPASPSRVRAWTVAREATASALGVMRR